MTHETLNEQQGFLVNQLIAQHEKDIRLEKGLSFGNGAIVSAVFITMLLVAAHLIGMIDLIGTTGGCK